MMSLNHEVYKGLSWERLNQILEGIKCIKIALIGDICLDLYWKADMTKSELSRETPHHPLPVVAEWMSPGGGGNVVSNIAALEPAKVKAVSVIGNDWRGTLLLKELEKRKIETDKILISSTRVTSTYCKPLRKGTSEVVYEDPRIDFDNYSALLQEEEAKLIQILDEITRNIDILCVSDQMKFGCITEKVREKINSLGRQGMKIVVDSRDRISLYQNVILKPNEVEGFKAAYRDFNYKKICFENLIDAGKILAERNCTKVCMTLGDKGCIYCGEGDSTIYIPTYKVEEPIDTCGAGDTFLSAFACATAAGAAGHEAAAFANLVSNIVIKKLGTTGVATPEEIRYIYKKVSLE